MSYTKEPTKKIFTLFELRNRCPKNQLHNFERFKAKHIQYKERIESLTPGLPPINWDYYKRNVRTDAVAMVEDFEKKYESLFIPYPEDKYTKYIDELKVDVQKEIRDFIEKSNQRIAAYEKEIKRIRCMMPYDQMTWEDFCILCPERAPDFINRPTFWPHNEEEQIGYVEEEVTDPKKKKK